MHVTPDAIGVILAIVGAVATIFGGMHVMLRRVEGRADNRFDKVDARFDKVDARFEKVDEDLRLIRADIVDLKVAVARIEGPQQTLLRAR